MRRRDEAIRRIMDIVEMPGRIAEDLVHHIRENKGTPSKERRKGEFKKLREDEVVARVPAVRSGCSCASRYVSMSPAVERTAPASASKFQACAGRCWAL